MFSRRNRGPGLASLAKSGIKVAVIATTLWFSPQPVLAQDNPLGNKTINITVGFGAGGAMDLTARVIADALGKSLPNTVVVQNKPGAGGNLATDQLVKSTADGSHLMLGGYNNALAPSLYKNLNHDPIRDLEPISRVVTTVSVLVVKPSLGIKSVKDLIERAKKDPGSLAYSSSGVGTSGHLAAEMLASMAGVKFLHVPYKGSPEQLSSLFGDQAAFSFIVLSQAVPQIAAGKLIGLAVSGPERSAQLPNVPTVRESGYPQYEHTQWYAIFGPKGIPPKTVDFLNKEIRKVLSMPDVIKQLRDKGLEPAPSSAKELGELLKSETANFAKIAKEAHIQPQ